MEKRIVTVTGRGGLHLRNAAAFVRQARQYESKIMLCKGCECADSCSILQMLSLGAGENTQIEMLIEGPDEARAARELEGFFIDGAGI